MEAIPDADIVIGPLIGLRTLKAVIMRSRRVWLVTTLLGLLIGAGLHVVIPHKYTATTDLYISQPVGADPTQAMTDDVSLLQTAAVATQAVTAHHLHMNPAALLSHYKGMAQSDSIMSISFSGDSQAQAVSDDRAIAEAFLSVQAGEVRLQTDAAVRGFRSQISTLNTAINDLNTSINSLSSAPPSNQTTDQLTELVNQRGLDSSQVSQLQDQIQQDLTNEQSVDDVNHVLDPAAIVPVSTKKVIVKDGLSGLVAGLALGIGAVVLRWLLSSRPLDRSIVAATVGAPVELSLGRHRIPRTMRKRKLSGQLRNPSSALRMIERRLRTHLESAAGSALAVVAVGADEPAALATGALALDLTSQGRQVVVVDAVDHRILASALGLKPKLDTTETFRIPSGDSALTVIVAPEDPAQMAQKPPPDDADAVLVLTTLDPAFGAEHLASWVSDAVLILSATGVDV